MLTNILKRKATILEKSVVSGALGDTKTWASIGSFWTRKVSVGVSTRQAYMQNNTVVSDKFIFNGELDLRLGNHRIEYDGNTYELAESAMHQEGMTTVITRRL